MSATNVKRRVVSVRLRADDTFGVCLGPGPDVFWYRTNEPPELGRLVSVRGARETRTAVRNKRGAVVGTVTLLEGGVVTVHKDKFSRRVVAPSWVARAHQVMKRPLYPHQAEGAGWLASRLSQKKGSILADDPGCGKTSQVLAALVSARKLPAIVVCPTSLKMNWAREVRHLKARLRVTVVNGLKGRIRPAHIIIVNYAILRGREAQLTALGAKAVVFDECHQLKEPQPTKSHRAAIATRIAHRVGCPLLLTGTPLLNRPTEFWRLLHMVDPSEWSSFTSFRSRYCASSDKSAMSKIVTKHGSASRIEELRSATAPMMLRRLKKDILTNAGKKTRNRVLVTLDPFDEANYKKAERDVVAWLKDVASDDRAKSASRGQAVVKLTMLRRIAAMGKLRRAVKVYLQSWFTQERRRLVVFGFHKAVLAGAADICESMGLRVAAIRGKDSPEQRQKEVDRFCAGGAEVFLAPIRSAGVGLNLQAASDVLFLERVWTPALMAQAEDRCYRIGQKRDVTVTYLDAKGTVDEYLASVLSSKQRLIDQVVDGRRFSRAQTVRTIDQVASRLKNPARRPG